MEEKGSDDEKHSRSSSVAKKPKYEMKPKVRFVDAIDVSVRDDHGKHPVNIIKNKIADGVKFKNRDTLHHHGAHSKPKEYLLLNDHTNFYKIDLQTKQIKTYESKECKI